MFIVWVAWVAGTCLTSAYVAIAVDALLYRRDAFAAYRWDTVAMLINGLTGIAGLVLGILNITLVGLPVRSIVQIARAYECPAPCTSRHDSEMQLATFNTISCLRFILWYAEFCITYAFVAYFAELRAQMICLRYATHALNLALSATALLLLCIFESPAFVIGRVPFTPFVWQCMLLMWVTLSFATIYSSKLYAARGIEQVLIRIRVAATPTSAGAQPSRARPS